MPWEKSILNGIILHICNYNFAGFLSGGMIVNIKIREYNEKDADAVKEMWNQVVANNTHAIHLYERLGFIRIGMVEGGFRMPNGSYEDIILFYHKV